MQSLERPPLSDTDFASETSTAIESALAGFGPESQASSASACALSELGRDQVGVIEQIQMPNLPHGHGRALVLRLLELGFVPGERVRIIATGPGGREPIAVRVAGTTFALRLHEAEHIRVRPLREPS